MQAHAIACEEMEKRDVRKERIRYMADLRRFVRQEFSYLSSQKILDAGCGTGPVSRIIKKNHPETVVIGIDKEAKSIKAARRKAKHAHLRIRYFIGSLDNIPLGDGTVDVVVAAIVLHHMPAKIRIKALQEFHRILKKNGNLVILEGKGLVRNLTSMMQDGGFRDVQKKGFGDIRRIYTGTK